jgi:hypothetical protein
MKLRLALALASVGWYFLFPPFHGRKDNPINFNAPLYEWIIDSPFDTAEQCAQYTHYVQTHNKQPPAGDDSLRARATWARLGWGVCVATDDPRLNPQNYR